MQGFTLSYFGIPYNQDKCLVVGWLKIQHMSSIQVFLKVGWVSKSPRVMWLFIYSFIMFYLFRVSCRLPSTMTEQQNRNLHWWNQGICIGLMFWGDCDLESGFGSTGFVEEVSAICGFCCIQNLSNPVHCNWKCLGKHLSGKFGKLAAHWQVHTCRISVQVTYIDNNVFLAFS